VVRFLCFQWPQISLSPLIQTDPNIAGEAGIGLPDGISSFQHLCGTIWKLLGHRYDTAFSQSTSSLLTISSRFTHCRAAQQRWRKKWDAPTSRLGDGPLSHSLSLH
jgi:hypothetical protein